MAAGKSRAYCTCIKKAWTSLCHHAHWYKFAVIPLLSGCNSELQHCGSEPEIHPDHSERLHVVVQWNYTPWETSESKSKWSIGTVIKLSQQPRSTTWAALEVDAFNFSPDMGLFIKWKWLKWTTNVSLFQQFILARKFYLFTWNMWSCFQLLLFYTTSKPLTSSELLSTQKNNWYWPIEFISCSSSLSGVTLLQVDEHLLILPWQRTLSKYLYGFHTSKRWLCISKRSRQYVQHVSLVAENWM